MCLKKDGLTSMTQLFEYLTQVQEALNLHLGQSAAVF